MCGVCGIVGEEDVNITKKMIKSLSHRGPDDRGIYSDHNITLGHTRLSIIDLEKGHQPMHNEDETIWVVFNGEIYNFNELKKQLKNHEFYTETDTEVLVHLYEEYGINFVNKLNGMFAFALWDSSNKLLVLARDPIGKKPLYYHFDGEKLIFASEIKAILESGVKKELNEESLCSYLAYLYVLGDETLFKGIKKLQGGHILTLRESKIHIKKYWDISEELTITNESMAINQLKGLLKKSAQYRSISDVDIGCFLSGGLDSSVTTALMKPLLDYDLHTFSIGFDNFSEFDYARIVSEQFETEHHEIIISPSDFLGNLKKITWYHDEPIGDAAIINNYYLADLAKKYVKVVIAGESGDELFGGYNNYKINLKLNSLFNIPFITYLSKILNIYPKSGNIYQNRFKWVLSNYLPFFNQNMDIAHLNSTRSIRNNEMIWLTNDLRYKNIEKKAIYPNGIYDPLNRMLALDCKNLLPGRYLMKAEKSIMAHSVEQRLPLMDLNIINFVFRLPGKFKIKDGITKYIFKKAVQDLVPHEIINRTKVGFGTPLDEWILDENLKPIIINQFDESPLLNKVIKREKIEIIKNRLKENDNKRSNIIWSLFALGIWYETFFSEYT